MSKSILIIDTPKHCGDDCILCQLDGVYVCRQTRQILNKDINEKTINRYCPLKPMPQKLPIESGSIMNTFKESTKYKHIGFNKCIDEILGEE